MKITTEQLIKALPQGDMHDALLKVWAENLSCKLADALTELENGNSKPVEIIFNQFKEA